MPFLSVSNFADTSLFASMDPCLAVWRPCWKTTLVTKFCVMSVTFDVFHESVTYVVSSPPPSSFAEQNKSSSPDAGSTARSCPRPSPSGSAQPCTRSSGVGSSAGDFVGF